jgi:uncharacterized protein (TIGR02680 family)
VTDQLFGPPQHATTAIDPDDGPPGRLGRWVLHRAGIVNVWQYDRVELRFADGRALFRGKNGAGKSKALEVLLPFLLDGDTRSIDASGRDRTTVGWLMTDGREPGNHVGYVWLELRLSDGDGEDRFCTLGAGLKSSSSTKQSSTWFFLVPDARVGTDIVLETDGECLSLDRLKAQLGDQVTTSAPEHRRRVAYRLFGLRHEDRYANLLHLLHRLRDPNIGNRIEAGELAAVLRDALPPPSETALEDGAERFDTLEQVREQLERTQRTAAALGRFMASYVGYATTVLRGRAEAVLDAVRSHRRAERRAAEQAAAAAAARAASDAADAEVSRLHQEESDAAAQLEGLQQSDAYKQHLQMVDRRKAVHAAGEAAEGAESSAQAARRAVTEAASDVAEAQGRADELAAHLAAARPPMLRQVSEVGVDPGVIPALPGPDTDEAGITIVRARAVAALDVATGRRRAAEAVRRLAEAAITAGRSAEVAEERADRSEQELAARQAEADGGRERWEEASGAWRDEVRGWPAEAVVGIDWGSLHAVLLEGPADAEELELAARSATALLAPHRQAAREAEATATGERTAATETLAAKEAERAALAATDEASPEPGRYRSARRDPAQGTAFYELVEFRAEVPDDDRAGVEAALEAAGLLDAWVGADGLVVHPATRDVLVRPGVAAVPVAVDDLTRILLAAVPEGSAVSEATVNAILSAVGLMPSEGDRARGTHPLVAEWPWVSVDGRWSLGLLQGAWAKEHSEYLGAGARRATRERRLVALAAECEALRRDLEAAEAVYDQARALREHLDRLPDTFPAGGAVAAAASEAEVSARVAASARARHAEDRRGAEQARTAAARAVAEARQAAAADNLPVDLDGLDAVIVAARELATALGQWDGGLGDWSSRIREVAERSRRLAVRRQEADEAIARSASLRDVHRQETASLAALEGALRATVDEVLTEIEATTARRDAARAAGPPAAQAARERADGAARAEEQAAQARHEAARLGEGVAEVAGHLDVALLLPGTARAALGRDLLVPADLLDSAVSGPAASAGPTSAGPAATAAVAQAVLDSTASGVEPVSDRVILNRYDELQAGLAGGYDIAVDEDDGVKYFHVSDDTGRQPLPVVAARVEADAEAARTRLAASEREVIVRFLLGELGDELRDRLLEAEDLVAATNTALDGVRTSHGKGARLEWKVDPDEPEEARTARRLLLLSPRSADEDAQLQAALLALIQTRRELDPTGAYLDHLRKALDYRDWHRFTVLVLDDARPGTARTLSNRLGLSQGEQRVLSYLALFAAASASFDAIGGASPRLLLLDDAFAKVDEPTHGRLLELLVQLDLDFLVTSERLWGCFPAVPSLEIYEALREPTVPGVALVHFHWDGHQRHLVGL